MALFSVMRIRFLTSATAAFAAFATESRNSLPIAAIVAGVALAKLSNSKNSNAQSVSGNSDLADGAASNLKTLLKSLVQFRFDFVWVHIESGCPANDISSFNNCA